MRIRWSVILPIIGLLLFAVVTYRSLPLNRHEQDEPRKYYWWSSLQLDSDPLNHDPAIAAACANKTEGCARLDLRSWDLQPAWLDRVLVLSALPAFLAGFAVVAGLSKLGVDEVLTFMVSMPILIFAWYFFVGWLLERWSLRRQQRTSSPLKIV
jgi:hypothetical protein